mmetsp:Transcript_8983/g.9965  ORF Transcript_8983/g.9965 Transcript_8983/m.9965 type:complete len:142 (+) Transcript_8983:42-467(+)
MLAVQTLNNNAVAGLSTNTKASSEISANMVHPTPEAPKPLRSKEESECARLLMSLHNVSSSGTLKRKQPVPKSSSDFPYQGSAASERPSKRQRVALQQSRVPTATQPQKKTDQDGYQFVFYNFVNSNKKKKGTAGKDLFIF